jgi:hypothetical protein
MVNGARSSEDEEQRPCRGGLLAEGNTVDSRSGESGRVTPVFALAYDFVRGP